MNVEEQRPSTTGDGTGSGIPASTDTATHAVHTALRRRLILGGMVGLPATLAVMKPIKTLAKAKKSCSYSGWHSFKLKTSSPKASAHPKNSNCYGGKKSPFWYSKAKKKLPASKTKKKNHRTVTVTSNYQIANYAGVLTPLYQTTTFSQLFGSGTTQTIISCLSSGSTTQGAFMTALLNATYLNGVGYPYKATDIYAIWKTPTKLGTGVTQAQAGLFFQQLDAFG